MSFGFIDILQSLIDGILFGSIYALIGLGFTLIFGAMEKLNMAYAASSIGGAYVGLGLATLFSLPLFLVFNWPYRSRINKYSSISCVLSFNSLN